MRTFRNGAFLVLVASLVLAADQSALAASFTPTYPVCEDGCTCTVNPQSWSDVVIECENVAPIDECPYAWDSCTEYCGSTLPNYWNMQYPWDPISCELYDLPGCSPYPAFEPPTYIECQCGCWR